MCDGNPGCGAADALSSAGQSWLEDSGTASRSESRVNLHSNPITHLPGVLLVQHRDGERLLLEMPILGQRSLAQLAQLSGLSVRAVAQALIDDPACTHLLPGLYAQAAQRSGNYPGDQAARAQIAAELAAAGGWTLPREIYQPVLLPVSDSFRQALLRERARLDEPAMRRLVGQLQDVTEAIDNLLPALRRGIDDYKARLRPYRETIAGIAQLDTLVQAMREHPKPGEEPGSDDVSFAAELHERIARLAEQAGGDLLQHPPGRAAVSQQHMAAYARALRLYIEEGAAGRVARAAQAHAPILRSLHWQAYVRSTGEAYQLLAQTPEAEHIMDHHMPAVCRQWEASAQGGGRNIELGPSTAAWIISGLGQVPTVFGNVPGPSSFSMILAEAYVPLLLQRSLGNPAQRGLLLRGLLGMARLMTFMSRTQWEELGRLVRNGQMDRSRSLLLRLFRTGETRVGNNPAGTYLRDHGQAVPRLNLLIGMVNVAILIANVNDDEASTADIWLSILSNGLGSMPSLMVGLSTIRSFKNASDAGLIRLGRLAGQTADEAALQVGTRIFGQGVALVVGAVAMYSSYSNFQAARARGDETGMWLEFFGGVGALASFSGSLVIFVSALAGAQAVPVVGQVLLIVGLVIGLAVVIWGALRELLMEGTQKVFRGYIESIYREGGALRPLLQQPGLRYADLRRAFNRVYHDYDELSFWPIDPAPAHPRRPGERLNLVQTLSEQGFAEAEVLAELFDESEAFVRQRLAS